MQLMLYRQMRDQAAARRGAGPVLNSLVNQPQSQPAGPLPMPPGSEQGPLPPQVGQDSAPAQSQGGASPMAAPAGPQPYQVLPQAPPPELALGAIGPPPEPAPAAAPTAAPAAAAPKADTGQVFNLPNIIKAMKQNNVPDAQMMDMLDALSPAMSAANQGELKLFQAHMKATEVANKAYFDSLKAETSTLKTKIQMLEHERKTSQGDERNRIREADLQRKIEQAVGGLDNLKRTEFIKDGEGNTIGVNGITKSGKIIKLDMEGNPRSEASPTPGPKADANKVREINALRGELSTLSNLQLVTPTPERKRRMDAIEKRLRDYGAAAKPITTSGGAAPAAAGGARPAGVPASAVRQTLKDGRSGWYDKASSNFWPD